MLISTTPTLKGKTIKEYRGIVFGEIVNVVYFLKDITTGFLKFTGGRSDEYEKEIIDARADALDEMMQRAANVGANAVVGVTMDYEVLGGSMLMITATGTAVVVD